TAWTLVANITGSTTSERLPRSTHRHRIGMSAKSMFWSWFKSPAHRFIYASCWLLLALAMALPSVAAHALIRDYLTYTQALTLALATCLLWAALLPQIIQWSGHISDGFPLLRSLATHAGLAVGFVLVSVGWRFALDVLVPSLRRVQGTPSTVFGI